MPVVREYCVLKIRPASNRSLTNLIGNKVKRNVHKFGEFLTRFFHVFIFLVEIPGDFDPLDILQGIQNIED